MAVREARRTRRRRPKSGEIDVPRQGAGQRDRAGTCWPADRQRRACRSARSRSRTTTRTGTAKTFDLDRDLKIVDEKVGAIVNAVNPDLSAFKARGGKLLMYHGWNDTAISRRQHHQLLLERAVEDGREAGQLRAAVHGAGHAALRRRPGPESGQLDGARSSAGANRTPRPITLDRVRVTNNRVDMTRPLCPYPQVAQYKGIGQHQRRRELRLQGALTKKLSSRRHEDTRIRSRENAKPGFVTFVIFVFS